MNQKFHKSLIIKVIAIALTIFGFLNTVYADVDADLEPFDGSSPGSVLVTVELTGNITEADALRFERMLTAGKQHFDDSGGKVIYIIKFESAGGDIAAAMSIGRVIRSMKALAKPKGCYSACVLVLAGAGYRAVDEKSLIGIHRPYQREAVLTTPEKEKQKYKLIQTEVENYLTEMNVSLRLYADMMIIPPDQLKILTLDELSNYGLAGNDPYFDEADAMAKALKAGVSRQELARRKALVRHVCNVEPCNIDFGSNACLAYFLCAERVEKTGK